MQQGVGQSPLLGHSGHLRLLMAAVSMNRNSEGQYQPQAPSQRLSRRESRRREGAPLAASLQYTSICKKYNIQKGFSTGVSSQHGGQAETQQNLL